MTLTKKTYAKLPVGKPLFGCLAALGALSAMAAPAQAVLVTRQLDLVLDGSSYLLDLNQDGTDDFRISDSSGGLSSITSLNNAGGVLGAQFGPDIAFPIALSLGDTIDKPRPGASGFYGGTRTLYGEQGAPFNEIGSTGYIGLRLTESRRSQNFGFLEITRGSTILGTVGYETTPNTPALITAATAAVPEPGSALFFGLAGVGAFVTRRRQTA